MRSIDLTKYQTGTSVPAVSQGALNSIRIGLPPLAEQKRIVAKVDELMGLCDRLETQQQERDTRHAALARASLARFADASTPANLNLLFHPSYTIAPADLRKTILTLAVQGELVPQDPNDEPADTLLARVRSREVKDTGRRKTAEIVQEITPSEIPFELPTGWVWEHLGNIGETNIGLTYSPQDVSEVGIPVLRSSNIQNGKLDFSDLVRVKCEPKRSVMVQDGDLLICARNGSRALVGKVAVIENMEEPAAFGAFMAIFRSEVNQYLYHFIRSPLFRQMIDEVNTTTINQITQNNLRSTLAPIPPLAEQRRIVAKVNQLMTLVDQLETQLSASRAAAMNLMDAAVAELTVQE
jgi:type I restriction enzyme S subunit